MKKNNIKHFRKKAGLTQQELAEKTNLSRSYIADIENGRYNPSLDTLKSIASILHVSVQDLLDEDADNQEQELSPKSKRIVDSLARAKDLDETDFEHIAEQVEALIKYAQSKKKKDTN